MSVEQQHFPRDDAGNNQSHQNKANDEKPQLLPGAEGTNKKTQLASFIAAEKEINKRHFKRVEKHRRDILMSEEETRLRRAYAGSYRRRPSPTAARIEEISKQAYMESRDTIMFPIDLKLLDLERIMLQARFEAREMSYILRILREHRIHQGFGSWAIDRVEGEGKLRQTHRRIDKEHTKILLTYSRNKRLRSAHP